MGNHVPGNLKQAIKDLERVLELAPEGHPARPSVLGNLGNARLALYERTGDPTALEQAIARYEEALELTPEGHPNRPSVLGNLGNARHALHERTGDPTALEQAIAALEEALELGADRNPPAALMAGRSLILFSFREEKWSEIGEVYERVLAVLRRYITYQTDQSDLAHTLSHFQRLPALAAWAQVELDNPQKAVIAFESGRTFVLREALERSRHDLERLPELGYPDLYECFREAEQSLRELERTPFEHRSPGWLSKMDEARGELERAAEEIRKEVGETHPEFRFLMRPLPFSEIEHLAAEAPLVYLFATSKGGLALAVQKEGAAQTIRLPRLTENHVHEVLIGAGSESNPDPRSYLGAYGRWRAKRNQQRSDAWFRALNRSLDFLGETLAPLREFLGQSGYNRVTLIPSGLLALLPLHAARFEDGTYFLEHHTFTYTPSAHALYYARLAAERGHEPEPLLAVENPTRNLPFARLEVEAIREHFSRVERLAEDRATVEAVGEALPGAGVFHFSGHGAGGWGGEEPRLQLADGVLPLSVLMRTGQTLSRLRLAVLSACETGVPDPKALNESLGLPAGFLLAGAPGVVGSLWLVSDAATALLIARFYEELCSKNADAAEALRKAQEWMLRASPEEKKASLARLDAEFRGVFAGTRMSPEVAKGMSDLVKSGGRKAKHPYYWAAFGYYGAPVVLERCGNRRAG